MIVKRRPNEEQESEDEILNEKLVQHLSIGNGEGREM